MRTRGIQLPTPGVKTRKPPKPVNTASPAFKAALAGCRGILQALKPKPAPGHPTP
jgi:hypothetical protein